MEYNEQTSAIEHAKIIANERVKIINITASGNYAFQLKDQQIFDYQEFETPKAILDVLDDSSAPLILHIQSHNQTFVPQELLQEKNVEHLINYVPLFENQKVYGYALKKLHTLSLFSAFQAELLIQIEQKHPKVVILDQLSAFLEPLELKHQGFHLHLDAKGFIAVFIQNEKLQFAKHFICNNAQELQYYLNLMFKELPIAVTKPNIFISGQNAHFQSILDILKSKYGVQETPISVYDFEANIPETALKQEIAYLSDIYRCVLLEEN